MWMKWMPWTWLVRRAAKAGGFLDPVAVLDRVRRFAQPSEVMEPTELLRAGLVFHARGLVNSRAIQHNLDWVWPYWAERQFDPLDESFLPRSFSVTHVNLTNRNWTAVGLPGLEEMPIVDPRGLLTPFLDGWSLDVWFLGADGRSFFPSRAESVNQRLVTEGNLAVVTQSRGAGFSLSSRVEVVSGREASCVLRVRAEVDVPGWVGIILRPCTPEGVSFIHRVERLASGLGWRVNVENNIYFGESPDAQAFSRYVDGDVRLRLPAGDDREGIRCGVGMATAAALFKLEPGNIREIQAVVPLNGAQAPRRLGSPPISAVSLWDNALSGAAELRVPDPWFRFLYDAALRSLILHSPGDVYPGPYTYKRFWFRDAAFILNALACAGLLDRVESCLERFFPRQRRDGYFLSQEGEWDSNGEALWILERFRLLSGRVFRADWRGAVQRGADWIARKRLPDDPPSATAGLLPAGFSAEHLGPNDFYYWDDFWGVAGLEAAAALAESWGDVSQAALRRRQARGFRASVDESLRLVSARLGRAAMPASPGRRMDSGAVGSLAASYPLRVFPSDDRRVIDTVEFLFKECFLRGGFFQDVVHSGVNPYLTLHVAQVMLRAGDGRFFALASAVAQLASPTGQWPEAIHPRTGGGCMGDGQHVWASAEWVMMMRNMFLREEDMDTLVLASGIPPEWREAGDEMSFGPTPTAYGPVTVTLRPGDGGTFVSWKAVWRGSPPRVEVRLPGCPGVTAAPGESKIFVADRFAGRKAV